MIPEKLFGETMFSVDVAGLDLDNPFMLASGVLGSTGSSLKRIALEGAGAVVTKSLGLEGREGHCGPNVVEVEGGLLNSLGLPNPGLENFGEEIRVAKEGAKEGDVPVIVSVYAGSSESFREVAVMAEELGADAIELNLSCPHAEGYGSVLGTDAEIVEEVASEIGQGVSVPVFAKLSPNVENIVEIGLAAERGGVDGIVAVNTLGPGMVIDIDVERPILGNKVGGISGPALHPVAVRCVYELFEELDVPIVGVGGINDLESAIEMFMAGSRAIQVGTALKNGLKFFREISSSVEDFLTKKGYGHINEIVGVAHGQA